ncbi:MAG TPA: hypothetical protein VNC50_16830 [Planctomycetia bacterium]|nr:hypothetical protein [Planctomycetia bacterium]
MHAAPLLAGGVVARLKRTDLPGRLSAFHAAERHAFPVARALSFCRDISPETEYCVACRQALADWLDAERAADRLDPALVEELLGMLQPAARLTGSSALGGHRSRSK